MDNILSKRSKYAYNAIEEEDTLSNQIQKKGAEVIRLNKGDPPQYIKTPKYIIDAYIKALKEYKTTYSDSTGLKELKEAVSNRYKRNYKVNFTSNDVIVTQGVSEALSFINSSLINNGDNAMLFKPYYPQYMPLLQMYGGKPIIRSYEHKLNWGINPESMRKALKSMPKNKLKKIKYMLITNPNNPTGTVLSRKILEDITDIANEFNLFLISDEIYDEIIYNGAKFTSISQIAKGMPHMVLNGASKVYDATGFRIGFMIIPENDKFSNMIKSKLRNYALVRLSVNTPAQYAIAEAINNKVEHDKAIKEMVKEISDRVNYSFNMLKENEYLDTIKPNGSFYIFPKINMEKLKFKNDKEFVEKLLKEKGVQVTRGSGFGEPGYFRIVSLPPKTILKSAISKINDFCIENKKK